MDEAVAGAAEDDTLETAAWNDFLLTILLVLRPQRSDAGLAGEEKNGAHKDVGATSLAVHFRAALVKKVREIIRIRAKIRIGNSALRAELPFADCQPMSLFSSFP